MPAPCVFPYQSTGDQPQARKMSDFERWEKRYGASGHFSARRDRCCVR
jgi:hypothetical protein